MVYIRVLVLVTVLPAVEVITISVVDILTVGTSGYHGNGGVLNLKLM